VTNRRSFLSTVFAPALAGLAQQAGAMRITRIDTIYWKSRDDAPFWPHWTWVRLHTDSGLTGVGETYPNNAAEATYIHEQMAPRLKGREPRDIERIWADLYHDLDYRVAGGVELRALSALDLALWDLLGKSLQAPVYRLLGGKSNARVRLYNTCFPHKHDFHTAPERIMQEVMDGYGIRAIKIWPFDRAAQRSRRQYITPQDIDEALKPVRLLRDKFGSSIEILMEFHANWNLPAAVRIAKALEPYQPMWLEDMLLPGQFAQYRELAEATSLPLAIGERMGGKLQFQSLLESKAVKFVMFDVCWCGGVTEARKITALAEAQQLPFAPHTAGGPLLFYASTHLSTAMPNVWIQESCQRFYEHDWPAMLENPLVPREGSVAAPEEPGFGMRIKPEVWEQAGAVTRSTGL
jgi:L-alanine-DL-glutamate epimerase-like enolase superfamily enzyme